MIFGALWSRRGRLSILVSTVLSPSEVDQLDSHTVQEQIGLNAEYNIEACLPRICQPKYVPAWISRWHCLALVPRRAGFASHGGITEDF